jgi:hypothetical protein
MGAATFLRLYPRMRAGEETSTRAGAWFVEAEPASIMARAGGRSPARFAEKHEGSGRVVIVSSLFLVLFAAGLLIGGHAAIDPLLQSAMEARAAKASGDVVFAMPDGIYCRHMSFDNATAEVTEGAIERCGEDFANDRARAARSFAWRAR